MKTQFIYLLIFQLLIGSCMKKDTTENNDNSKQEYFANPQEAAKKAKSDFLEVMKSSKDLNLGFNASALEGTETGNPFVLEELDFDKILSMDSSSSFNSISKGVKNTIVPFLDNKNVVTVAMLRSSSDGYSISGLGDAKMALDLTILDLSDQSDFTAYEVPNLNIIIYKKVSNSTELYFTDYEGRFNLSQGVSFQELSKTLKSEAILFNRKYGDEVKKQKLVR